jgi:hypothetical protein
VAVTVVAYAPWEKGPITKACQEFISYYAPRWFERVSILAEGGAVEDSSSSSSSSATTTTSTQTFYAVHPHGAFCIGWALLFCHSAMQQVRFCFAPFLYASPFFRLFSRCVGNPGSAAKFAMIQHLQDGESLALPPGGFEEATLACTTQDRVFLKKRTGFIRLMLQQNKTTHVRPVYVFGEKNVFWNIQGGWKSRLAVNRYGIPTILAWGHPLLPLVPKNTVPLYIVIGAPLVLPKMEPANVTKDDVTHWHNKYVAALTKLFEDHKEAAYGPEVAKTMKLEVW